MEQKDFVRELPKNERSVLHENAPLPPRIIYNIIRQEGEEELKRPLQALAFSGLAAGVLVSFSFFIPVYFSYAPGRIPGRAVGVVLRLYSGISHCNLRSYAAFYRKSHNNYNSTVK